MYCAAGGNDVAPAKRFRALTLMAKIIVDEEHRIWPFSVRARAFTTATHSPHSVGAKAKEVSEKSGYRAELAAVRTASPGLDGNNAK